MVFVPIHSVLHTTIVFVVIVVVVVVAAGLPCLALQVSCTMKMSTSISAGCLTAKAHWVGYKSSSRVCGRQSLRMHAISTLRRQHHHINVGPATGAFEKRIRNPRIKNVGKSKSGMVSE